MLVELSGIELVCELDKVATDLLGSPKEEPQKKQYSEVREEILRRLEAAEKNSNPWRPGKGD